MKGLSIQKNNVKTGDVKMTDIEALLEEGKVIQIKPEGYSMYPMLVPKRDEAIIAPYKGQKLKRGDVILYRREGSILVLHRIYKVKKDGIYMVGDNQEVVEGPLPLSCVRGILVAFIRKGHEISVENIVYRFLFGVWLFLRPIRKYIKRPVAKVKKVFKS